MLNAFAFTNRHVSSVLSLTYHSTTPYLLGKNVVVKYKIIGKEQANSGPSDPHMLSKHLWNSISHSSASFIFGIVVQSHSDRHPIENSNVNWEDNGAVFVEIATIFIDAQNKNDKKEKLAEQLTFNPWNCLPDHRPLGHINRARKLVYSALSELRIRRNSDKW